MPLTLGAVDCWPAPARWHLPKRFGTSFLCTAVLACAGWGCNTTDESEAIGSACTVDSDCPGAQVCREDSTARVAQAIAAPPVCYLRVCQDVDDCSEGEACMGLEQAAKQAAGPYYADGCEMGSSYCGESCATAGCEADEFCLADGRCELAPCDAPGAPACPEHWRCDPVAARAEPAYVAGTTSPIAAADLRAPERGCARVPCDEAGGFECIENWRCDLSVASDTGGCTPIPCVETGVCASDIYICTPTSSMPRPSGTDVFGCVRSNCEEGRECIFMIGTVNVGYCDFNGPNAGADGCAQLPCDEVDGLCYGALVCDPGSSQADERGCRQSNCLDGAVCPTGRVCDPSAPNTDAAGCVLPVVDGSGGTGAGGASSGGGSGPGGAGSSTGGAGATNSGGTGSGASTGGGASSGATGGIATDSGGSSSGGTTDDGTPMGGSSSGGTAASGATDGGSAGNGAPPVAGGSSDSTLSDAAEGAGTRGTTVVKRCVDPG